MNERIKPIVMPKWGLSMSEGKVTGWLKSAGAKIAVGDEIVEVETDKIAGVVEAGDAGTLRRVLGEPDTVYPVKALIGIIAADDVPDGEIDAYVAEYASHAAEEGEEEEAGPRYEFVDTPAGRLRYAKRGDGEQVIILIHGFGGDLDNWLFNIDALAEACTVYALDLPGHGQSDKAVREASLKGLSDAVTGFMDALGISAAHLVGHSMGGAIAAQTALDHPDRVSSITLIGSAGLGAEINSGYTDDFVAATSRRDLKPVLEQLFHDPATVTRQLVDDLLKYKRLDGVDEALRALSSALFPGGRQSAVLAEALMAASTPALVIWGESDRVIPAAHAAALGDRARAEVISGAGHMVQMEKAGRVNDLVIAHIKA
ncbi:MAG: acetoin dehydrogenase dihydrolipoyllysine-residue acetyltransferase subunit [Chelatococcus sp.]|uniref:acetoin dehydrogenase dihydrolipoyllysine-residue acetyltransferase subunit n=1 Tax=Chelatococcus sp. TaxID=1953771 RepID=UPI0025C2F6D8|nr:acetoin dehydrogenase dihydrolipoyllysine-residue acetyltransferase subunit [Chelatococcus sp.]MBX3538369.1 acetoin dehydrogenase dihydrolipoyllysine-residue acetyltransferase subunit [Chelatococcus sp.]